MVVTSRHDLTVVLRFVAAIVAAVHRKVLRLWDQEEVAAEEHSKHLLRLSVVSSYRGDKSESLSQAERLLRWRFPPPLLLINRRKKETAAREKMEVEEILLRVKDWTVVLGLKVEGFE